MDSDDYSDDHDELHRPRPSRQMPRRAAKLKEPARLTRSAAAHASESSSSNAQTDSDDADQVDDDSEDASDQDEEDGAYLTNSGQKRKASQIMTAASKRPRRTHVVNEQIAAPNRSRRKQRPSSRRSVRKSLVKKTTQETTEPPASTLPGDWHTLPYMTWELIFDFVAAPINDENARREDVDTAIETLQNATKASKILVEPAITARYRCIHLKSHNAAESLISTLRLRPGQTALGMRYRSKIETIRIEVGRTLSTRLQGSYVSVFQLLHELPRLANIDLYHFSDLAYTRDALVSTVRWKYSEDLFRALAWAPPKSVSDDYAKSACTELRSWTWNARLAGNLCPLEKLAGIHQTPSFASLHKVQFVNYHPPSIDTKIGDDAALALDLPVTQQLADAICALPDLEYLAFRSSTVVNGHLLGLLPKNLKHLELHDCYDVTAEALRAFLLTHGHRMQRLTLDHCRALSLDFLPVLQEACPNLTHLCMDLQYFRYIQAYSNDNSPEYDMLLRPDQKPTWPRTMQYIAIQHMRFSGPYPVESATVLLKSLVDSAAALPDLRHITLKASIDAIRRERYKLRDTWVRRMEGVFKRESKDPEPVPKRRFIIPIKSVRRQDDSSDPSSLTRRSSRIAEQPLIPIVPGSSAVELSQRHKAVARRLKVESKRLRISGKDYRADNEDSEDELSSPASGYTPVSPFFKQRLCDIVDVQVDNQKFSEHQFTEEDFLDSPNDEEDDEYED